MARREDQAFVTLATNDQYCYGALVLGQSLRDNGTTRQLAILVTPQVSQPMRQQLSLVYDQIRQVDPLDSQDEAHLALMTRPELGITFSKLHCWTLTQYSKCVFLDADTLVLHNVDDLFEREELSAAPDIGWPDCFNSGVFVFKPSQDTYSSLLQCAVTQGSFDGGDQGLLNTFFSSWATEDIRKHLPFIYNMTSNLTYTYKPALLRFGESIKIVHFIGTAKPWRYTYNTLTNTVSPPSDVGYGNGHQLSFVQAWWNVFMSSIKPRIEQQQARQESLSTFPQSLFPSESHFSNLPSNSAPYPAETPLSLIGTTTCTTVHSNTPPSTTVVSDVTQSFETTVPNISIPPVSEVTHESQQSYETSLNTLLINTTFFPPEESSATSSSSSSSSSSHVTHQSQVQVPPHPSTTSTSPSATTGAELATHIGGLSLESAVSNIVRLPGSPRTRQHAWEQGEVDYMGSDSFDNINQFIQEKINNGDEEKEKEKEVKSDKKK